MLGCADNLERALTMLSGTPTTQELVDRLSQLEKEASMMRLASSSFTPAEAEGAGSPGRASPTSSSSSAAAADGSPRPLDESSPSAARPSSSLTSTSAQEEEDSCAVCYSIMCRPARLSECSHVLCRLCVFKCRLWEAGCPMCRAPLLASVSGVRFPSELEYDSATDTAIARRHPSEHRESAAKEEALEARLRAHLMGDLPLVMHPGSIPCDANGKRQQMRIAKDTKVSMVFDDPQVRALARATSRVRSHCHHAHPPSATPRVANPPSPPPPTS